MPGRYALHQVTEIAEDDPSSSSGERSAHSHCSLGLIPSGPVAFLTRDLFSSLFTWCRVRNPGGLWRLGGMVLRCRTPGDGGGGGRGSIECLELSCEHLWECCWSGEVRSGDGYLGEGGKDTTELNLFKKQILLLYPCLTSRMLFCSTRCSSFLLFALLVPPDGVFQLSLHSFQLLPISGSESPLLRPQQGFKIRGSPNGC